MAKSVFNIQKVQRLSAEVQSADTLRNAILSGVIPLGARLTEISASEQLGVSRSTIRTAFHQLVQEGLVIQTPYTGWSVMTLSANDAWELYTLRASLEALAAQLVASRIQHEGIEGLAFGALKTAFEALQQACNGGEKRQIASCDMNLHQTIIDLSNHGRLIDQYSRIKHQISIYIQSSDALVVEGNDIISQHLPLMKAMEEGDSQAAMHAAMLHNQTEGSVLVNYLKESTRKCA